MRVIIGRRITIALIDFFIVFILAYSYKVATTGGFNLVLRWDSVYRTLISFYLIQNEIQTLLPALIVLTIAAYWVVPTVFFRGQTIGNLLTFTKVRQPNSNKPQQIHIFLRFIIASPMIIFVSTFLFSLIFSPLNFAVWTIIIISIYAMYYVLCMFMLYFRYDLQTPHDILSDTVVLTGNSSHFITINNSLKLEKINEILADEKISRSINDRDRLRVSKSLYQIVRGDVDKVIVRGSEQTMYEKKYKIVSDEIKDIKFKIVRGKQAKEPETKEELKAAV